MKKYFLIKWISCKVQQVNSRSFSLQLSGLVSYMKLDGNRANFFLTDFQESGNILGEQ